MEDGQDRARSGWGWGLSRRFYDHPREKTVVGEWILLLTAAEMEESGQTQDI